MQKNTKPLFTESKYTMVLSEKEKHLIEIIRSIECASVEVYIQDYIPLRLKKISENIKL
jgi:hypothetical protein